MKKLLIILIVLGLLVGGGFYAFTKTLDAQSYKKQIIQATQELTGHSMEVSGPVNIQLFPTPTITLNDVKIKNKPGSTTPNLATIKRVNATVKWGSLFETPLMVEKITLDTPTFYMERGEKGQVNWDFPFLQEKTINPEQDNLIGKSILEVPPQFKSLSIYNGSITYTNALSGFKQSFHQIKGDLTADSINGPFKFTGSFAWNDTPIRLALTTSSLFATQSADIKLTLIDSNSKAQINLTGKLENLTKTADMTGAFSINVQKMAPFLKMIAGYTGLPDSLERPLVGTSTFTFSSEKATFDDMAFRYGTSELENSISGSLAFIYPKTKGSQTQIQSSLVLSKFDLDAFLPLLPKDKEYKSHFMAANRKISSDIDLKIKATDVTYRQASLKGTSLEIVRQKGVTAVKQLTTTLPGDTQITVTGDFDVVENAPQAKLTVAVDSKDLKKTAQWLNIPLPAGMTFANTDALKAFAQLTARKTDVTLDKINVEANDGTLTGSMTFSLTEKKPTGVINATLRNVNLDTYLTKQPTKEKQTLSDLWKNLQRTFVDSTFMSDYTVQFTIDGSDITFKNVPITQLSTKGSVQDNTLTLQSLKAEGAATANLTLAGTLQKQDNQLTFTNVVYDFNVPRASVFMDRAMITSPLSGQINSVSVSGTASGQPDALAFNTVIGFSQAQIKAQGQMQRKNAIPHYTVSFSIAHPNFHQFMKLFNEEYNRLPYLTGSFIFQADLSGTAESFTLSQMDGMIGTQRFKGDATVTKDLVRKIKANLTAPLFNFEKIYPKKDMIRGIDPNTGKAQFSNDLFDFGSFDGLDLDVTASTDKMVFDKTNIDLMSTHFTLKEKVLSLEYLKGTMNEGSLSLKGTLNAGTAEPIIDATVEGTDIKVTPDAWALGRYRLKNGKSTFLFDFNVRGNSLEDMVRSLSANGTYSVKDGVVSGVNLTGVENQTKLILHKGQEADTFEKTLSTQLSMGETGFTSLAGTYSISNGILRTSDSMFRSPESNAIIQATFDLPNWTVLSSIALTMTGFDGFPPISIVIKGLLHAAQVETDTSAYIRYLTSTSAQIRDTALQEKLERERRQAQMDADGRKKEAVRLATEANLKIDETQKIIQMAPNPQGEESLIRAQDAAAVINELSIKETISETDLKKIEEQYNVLLQRVGLAQKASMEIALTGMREQAQELMTAGQTTMNAINRIYQRLQGVAMIDSAYKKGFEMFTLMSRLNTFIDQSQDLSKNAQALSQMQQALQILSDTYDTVAKFDVDTPVSETDGINRPNVRGKIKRSTI